MMLVLAAGIRGKEVGSPRPLGSAAVDDSVTVMVLICPCCSADAFGVAGRRPLLTSAVAVVDYSGNDDSAASAPDLLDNAGENSLGAPHDM